MDEGLLNDLLECSVCLERLDTSSRVLPCQHTFCLKCLKVIVESHKELRCPECRILVEVKVDELPPNVLLMRILEGMKNNVPRKPSTGQRTGRVGHTQIQTLQGAQMRGDGKQLPPHARAMHDYISKEPGDLSFKKGETIMLQKKLDPFWYQGDCSGRSGMFPITYVQVIVPLPVPTALCKALYDFRMSAPDEEGCLAFDKGAIITVHRRVDENWAEGRLEQRVGIFPIAFVEVNQAARQLINSTPLNRQVPPPPEHPRLSHSDQRHGTTQHSQRLQHLQQMSISTPPIGQTNYQNVATMSHSHPNYHTATPPNIITTQHQILLPQNINQHAIKAMSNNLVTTANSGRNIMEPSQTKHALDLMNFTNIQTKSSSSTVGLQSVSRINEGYDRLRTVKYENYSTPLHTKTDASRNHDNFPLVNFNNVSSDSSSSVNTPSVGNVSSTTTPNTSSDTSTSESAEPSLPSSPDNNTERNTTVIAVNNHVAEQQNENVEPSLNTSMGVLSLNESSTATNTSLNVSLPPTESPLNTSNLSNTSQNQSNRDVPASSEPSRLDVPTSSKLNRSSGPESLLNFGLGLQAALSPSHGKDANHVQTRSIRDHRDKRHSLTPSTHLQANHTTTNRHSAEIIATSLLDQPPERDRSVPERETRRPEKERRRRRSGSNERPLPASFIALYPYKPQKPDELELRKGAIYTVTERCRDGWYKGRSERSQRSGVFPGNYVVPAPASGIGAYKHDKQPSSMPSTTSVKSQSAVSALATTDQHSSGQPMSYPWASSSQSQQSTPKSDKSKQKQDKSSISTGVSLMKRLAAMKKCKSPPPTGYSMDNPVFEDTPGTSVMLDLPTHPVHVRSGSCPSQLLRTLPSERRHKERPPPQVAVPDQHHRPSNEGPWQTQHRKSQSLDVTNARKDKHNTQTVKERFRCIVPYPPNSEYELELKLDDIVLVSKKRGDGWYKGTLQRTGRTGLFPASFVQSCPQE